MGSDARPWVRRIFLIAAGLLWVCVGVLLVEGMLRLIHQARVSSNPYIDVVLTGKDWPESVRGDSDLLGSEQPPSAIELPTPTREDEMLAHAGYVNSMDEGFLPRYGLYQRRTVVMLDDESGAPSSWYPSNWMNGERAQSLAGRFPAVERTAPRVDCLENPKGEPDYAWACRVYPRKGRPVILLDRTPRIELADTIWRQPHMAYKPHASAEALAVHHAQRQLRINNFGFRDDDVVVPKPDGVVRIVCVGGSTTEDGPTNGFTYPNLAELFLEEKFGAGRVEVINAGVRGANTERERARFPDFLMMDPDLVVFYNGVNDICHILLRRWASDVTASSDRFMSYRWNRDVLGFSHLPDDAAIRRALDEGPRANIAAMAAYAKSLGIDTAVCTFSAPDWAALDSEERLYFEYCAREDWTGIYFTFRDYLAVLERWNETIRDLCREAGLPCIPVAEQVTGGVDMFHDICHMRDQAIEQKARVVAEALEGYVAGKLDAM